MSERRELLLVTALTAAEPAPGKVRLTEKFVEGMRSYAQRWSGTLHAILQPGLAGSGNLDDLVYDRAELPFGVDILPLASPALRQRLLQAAVVMGPSHHEAADIAPFCARNGVPYVFNSECSLRTRVQMVRAETPNLLRRLRRSLWECNQERWFRSTVRCATGVQCNGHPTYEAYRPIARDCLLYFDNRIQPDMLAAQEFVLAKLQRHASQRLSLVYTGRLTRIKGAQYLVPLARALLERGVDFELHICGDGDLRSAIEAGIGASGLQARVHMRGVLDFRRELVPFVTAEADLFVCCHPQGDPSCTYLETFACGVPIVGFANEAFRGLQRESSAGWVTPLGDVRALAEAIQSIARERQRLRDPALAALRFAGAHTFPTEFDRRIEHLERCAGQRSTRPG
jgi:glycosyltransferase involved in cell wall biosynthesis